MPQGRAVVHPHLGGLEDPGRYGFQELDGIGDGLLGAVGVNHHHVANHGNPGRLARRQDLARVLGIA